jgi:hypothetical protein
MSGLTQDEIVELTGYTADRVLRIAGFVQEMYRATRPSSAAGHQPDL